MFGTIIKGINQHVIFIWKYQSLMESIQSKYKKSGKDDVKVGETWYGLTFPIIIEIWLN